MSSGRVQRLPPELAEDITGVPAIRSKSARYVQGKNVPWRSSSVDGRHTALVGSEYPQLCVVAVTVVMLGNPAEAVLHFEATDNVARDYRYGCLAHYYPLSECKLNPWRCGAYIGYQL